jgi:membrane protein
MQLKIALQKVFFLLKETFNEFMADNGLKLSAALSFYTIFSLPPLLIIITGICGFFFGAQAVRGEIFWQIKDLVGNEAAVHIQEAIKNVKLSGSNTFATVAGLVILVIGASGVFSEIQESLNFIWGIEAKPKRGLVKFILNRMMSFSMIGSVGFLLMVGLVINSLTEVMNRRLSVHFPKDAVFLFYIINIIAVFTIITLLFTLIFKTLPDGRVVLRDCMIGASFSAFLFMAGKFAMGAYLGSSAFTSVYGATGSVILILIWVYYSAAILYFGAEFTKVYAHNHGQKITPNEYSIRVSNQKVEIGLTEITKLN